MSTELYLDTARLGRMCSGARGAERDFVKLVGQLGSSLYWDHFLRYGVESLPASFQRRVPHLRTWQGIQGLQQTIAERLDQSDQTTSYLFGQSQTMIDLAAECLCRYARSILTTDLEWPPYLETLRRMASRSGVRIHCLPLQQAFLGGQLTTDELLARVLQALTLFRCDGVFIADITYLGLALPIRELCSQLRYAPNVFIAIDGAQALHHRPISLRQLDCDLYLTGTQKWLGAFHPLRIALTGRAATTSFIQEVARHRLATFPEQDSLHAFCQSFASSEPAVAVGETVNVAALFTAYGALEATGDQAMLARDWHVRRQNAQSFRNLLVHSPLLAVPVAPEMRSGILLVDIKHLVPGAVSDLRSVFHQTNLNVSVFDNRWVRLSMPAHLLSMRHHTLILRSLLRAVRYFSRCSRRGHRSHL